MTTSSKRAKKYLSPYERPQKPVRVRETARLHQAVEWMWQYRLLTTKQWQRLLSGSEPMVKRFLRRMYDGYYFDKFPYPTQDEGRNPSLYILDKMGIDLLKRLGCDGFSGIPSKQISAFITIPHLLGISDFRIAFTQGIEQLAWQVEEWIPEHYFHRDYDFVPLPGHQHPKSLKPDGYIVVRLNNERISNFFLELDRATENNKTFETKVRCYVQYLKTGQFRRRFNAKGFRVLTVVDSPGRKRLDNLRVMTSHLEGIQRRFWFAHLDDVKRSNPLIDPIWTIAGEAAPATLFDLQKIEATE